MAELKHSKTPAIKIVRDLGIGGVRILELPVSHHHAIAELKEFPQELGFPLTSPRLYSVMNPLDDTFPGSGAHAHSVGTEKEIMFVPMGLATVYLWDKHGGHVVVELQAPKKGEKVQALFIPDGIWHTARYKPGTVMNVVASVGYDRGFYNENPEDYFVGTEALQAYQRTFPELPK